MKRTTLVIPCYNEAARLLPEEFSDFCANNQWLSFIFVDDGSRDATHDVLTRLAARAPQQMSVLRLASNSGKAEAVRRGVLQALSSEAELVGFWDADLATPLYNVEQFLRIFEKPEVQLVMGSRVKLLGRNIRRSPARHYLGRGFASVAALALGMSVYDTQCGAKIFRANDTFREIFAKRFELGWTFDIEMLARLMRISERSGIDPESQIVELPLQAWLDAPGSKLRPSHFPKVAWELGKLLVIARKR